MLLAADSSFRDLTIRASASEAVERKWRSSTRDDRGFRDTRAEARTEIASTHHSNASRQSSFRPLQQIPSKRSAVDKYRQRFATISETLLDEGVPCFDGVRQFIESEMPCSNGRSALLATGEANEQNRSRACAIASP